MDEIRRSGWMDELNRGGCKDSSTTVVGRMRYVGVVE